MRRENFNAANSVTNQAKEVYKVAKAAQSLFQDMQQKEQDEIYERRNEKLLLLKGADMSCECLAGDYPLDQVSITDKMETLNLNNWVHPVEQQSNLLVTVRARRQTQTIHLRTEQQNSSEHIRRPRETKEQVFSRSVEYFGMFSVRKRN